MFLAVGGEAISRKASTIIKGRESKCNRCGACQKGMESCVN